MAQKFTHAHWPGEPCLFVSMAEISGGPRCVYILVNTSKKMASKHSQTCSCTNHTFVITEALTCSEHITNHVHTCEGPVTQMQHLYLKITGCNLDTYDTNIMWPLGQLPEWIRQISIATRNANISSKAVSHPVKVFLSCKRVTSPQ